MKCLILAAGYATRLYPLTAHFPKPLLKVGDKAILDWLVDDMEESGSVEEYVVVTNHCFVRHLEAWAASRRERIRVVDDGTSANETRLGAVRDIQFAVEQAALEGDLLVVAGDNLLDFSLTAFIRYAEKKGCSCVMRFYEPDASKLCKAGVLTVDAEDRVIRMTEKSPAPETHWICPPFYYFCASDVRKVEEGIASGCGTDAPGSYTAWLCKQSPLYAMEMPGRRYDIGDLASYEEVKRCYKGMVK